MLSVNRINSDWYNALVEDIRDLEYTGIVITKHAIGKRILQDELKFGKPEYGTKKIEGLAKDLDTDRTDIYRCIKFAKKYPELLHGVQQCSWRNVIKNLLPEPRDDIETPPLPEGKYSIIYADPPWQYEFPNTRISRGSAKADYPTLCKDELCSFQI